MAKKGITRFIPLPVRRGLYKVYAEYAPATLGKMLGAVGYNVSRRKDFYSPLPTVSELRKNSARWNRPSSLSGLSFDLTAMKDLLRGLLDKYAEEFCELPPYDELYGKGFGLGYTPVDALTLYLMLREIKPKRYLEVGSGLSTYYASLAAKMNEENGSPMQIICIEPHPLEKLSSISGIEIIKSEVQDVALECFEDLGSGDVLFIDSSHSMRIDGDVPFLYLDALPILRQGVYIHVHDVPFPYNFPYPPELWIFGKAEPMFWTEAMVLQAFLAFNKDFEILLSLPMIRFEDEGFLMQRIEIYETVEQNPNAFSSIWLRRSSIN